MKLRKEKLRNQSELTVRQYVKKFETAVGVENLPIDYFEKNHTVVFRDDQNRILAGYCLVTKELRGFKVAQISLPEHLSKNDFFEINGVFISKKVKSKLFRIRYWSSILLDILKKCRGKKLLLWYNYDNLYLRKLYRCINARQILIGSNSKESKVKSHSNLFVGYQSQPYLVNALMKSALFYLKKAA